jgi:ketosteroid isomerase-like protein
MKRIIYLFAGILAFSSCSEKKAEDVVTAEASTVVEKVKPVYAYPVKFSDWEIGSDDNIKTIVDFYYAWDHKDAGKVANLCADTIRLRIPTDREEIVIPNNQISERLAKNRGMYDSTSNDILSAVSLHDKQSNEDWVMIVTYNKWTNKNGTRDSLLYSDSWRLKGGKIESLMSFYKLPTEQFINKNDPK